MATWKIENGFGVYDSAEDKLGTVGEVWQDHFEMDTGLLGFGKNYYIPYNAIVDVRDGKVLVRTTKERLDSMGWESKEGFLSGGIAAGPERPLGGFQSGKGGGPLLEGDEKIIRSEGTTRGGLTSRASREGERWEDVSAQYRERWETRHSGTSSGQWAEHEPGYRYGWEMSRRPEYKGKGWNEVEPEFRRDWQSRHSDKPWERSSQSLKEAWGEFSGTSDDSRDRFTMREDEALGDTRTSYDEGRRRNSPGLGNEGGRREPF